MIAARRLTGWPERLAEYVAARVSMPFAWGSNDCITFAAGAVEAITGQHPPMPVWHDVREAMRELRTIGGIERAVESIGLIEWHRPDVARRGDVVLVPSVTAVDGYRSGRPYMAVCLGHVCAAPGGCGIVYGPMSAAMRGWRVG
jgi:hypothetical protein